MFAVGLGGDSTVDRAVSNSTIQGRLATREVTDSVLMGRAGLARRRLGEAG